MDNETSRHTPQHATSKDTIDVIYDKVLPAITEIYDKVLPAVTSVDKKVDILANDVKHLKESTELRLTAAEKLVDTFRKEIYGNGNPSDQPGLKALMVEMKHWVDTRSSLEKTAIGGLLIALIGEIAGFIFVAIKLSALTSLH